jgi:hypothetical protein
MKKLIGVMVAVVLVIVLTIAIMPASASMPSAKATAIAADYTLIDATTGQAWTTILEQDIKTANDKDLFIDVALQCGLATTTKVHSKGNTTEDSSGAAAWIDVRVMDGADEAYPGVVMFAARKQVLTAKLMGELNEQTIELLIATMSANAFNFILEDVSSGEHHIEIQARISSLTTGSDSTAKAAVGKGSVTIEEVRMTHDTEIEMP